VPSERREPEDVTQGRSPRESADNDDGDNPLEEVDRIMEKELEEAQRQLSEKDITIAKLQEALILREASDFVATTLAKAELPDVTKGRLQRELVANPPVEDGQLNTEVYGEAIEAAVKEAKIEVATILGRDGRVRGMGGTETPGNGVPTVEESRKLQAESLARLGYGGGE
jgi:hypothetical protein